MVKFLRQLKIATNYSENLKNPEHPSIIQYKNDCLAASDLFHNTIN